MRKTNTDRLKKIKEVLYNIMLKARRNEKGGGHAIYWLMEDTGIRIAVSRFFNWRNDSYMRKHPSEQMKRTQKYYEKCAKEIQDVVSILEDDESKDIYRKIIRYRQFCERKDLPPNSYKTQYFENDFFNYMEGECFVDCGAFDGDTIRNFKKYMKKISIEKYRCICFEPDITNADVLKRNHPECTVIRAGVWSDNRELLFRIGHGDDNNIISEEEIQQYSAEQIIKIPVKCLDDMEECSSATFIKMDIEGSEQMALKGAERIIKRNKPKLAICIYHSDEDMVKIPLMIHEMVPQYRLFIRHHSNSIPETVLYATI